ncbi:MAG: polysaccharide deacetylase family protein [Elusimicrobia bacterium]|nr:polysaccharide deacetylase family protein [Candidatus Liberimonas magnetica]
MRKKIYLACLLVFLISNFAFSQNQKVFYADGPKDKKALSLTFDDGPAPNTKKVLNILKKHNIKATFFMEGAKLAQYPDIAKEVQSAGHEIGIHLYSHPNFYAYKKSDYREFLINEIEKTRKEAEKALGIKVSLLRMPNGYVRQWVKAIAKEQTLVLINWSFGTDWKKMTKEQLLKTYTEHIKPGAIFLLHDSGKKDKPMLEMLSDFIEELQRQGYSIVTISELLAIQN